jgi:GntR family transcriptional regulator
MANNVSPSCEGVMVAKSRQRLTTALARKSSGMSYRNRLSALRRATPRLEEVGNVPLYLRVAHSLRSRINSGEWKPDTQLPIIKKLAVEYDVALITIRQALRLLAADKLVCSQRGRGTFVTTPTKDLRSDAALRQAINDRLNLPSNCTIKVVGRYTVDELPQSLLPSAGKQYSKYRVVDKLHFADGSPFAFMSAYIERTLYEKLPKRADEKSKITKLVIDAGSLMLSSSSIQIVLQYADDRLAKLLDCAPLSALVRIRTLRCDMKGFIVLVTDAFYRGDKFLYEIEERNIDLARTNPMIVPDIKR